MPRRNHVESSHQVRRTSKRLNLDTIVRPQEKGSGSGSGGSTPSPHSTSNQIGNRGSNPSPHSTSNQIGNTCYNPSPHSTTNQFGNRCSNPSPPHSTSNQFENRGSNPSPPHSTSNQIGNRGSSNPSPHSTSNHSGNTGFDDPSPHSISNRISSPLPFGINEMSDDDPPEEDEIPAKKKRGPTKMRSLALSPTQRVEVEFNDKNQPIGLHSTWLSSYLGVLARDLVPVTIDNWRRVNKTLKDDLWTCVKARFKLDDIYKKLFVQVMGRRWKENKSRLVKKIKKASKSVDKEAMYARLKPDNVRSSQEWSEFLRKKLSKEFELKSEKFKEFRAKNKCTYLKSRMGYARLEDEMKKESPMPSTIRREDVWCKAHLKKNGEVPNAFVADCMSKIQEFNSSQTSREPLPINQDALAHVFGPERNGTVRGVGFGVTATQMGVHIGTSKVVHELQNKVSYLTNELKDIRNLLMHGAGSKHNDNENTSSPRVATPRSQNNVSANFDGSTNLHEGEVPRKCKLLNWQKMVVAEGTIASKDPNALAHHVPLGLECWKVWVETAVDSSASLWRTNSEMKTIGQAMGSPIAWNKDFISLD